MKKWQKITAAVALTVFSGLRGYKHGVYDNFPCIPQSYDGRNLRLTEADGDRRQFLRYVGSGNYVPFDKDKAPKPKINNGLTKIIKDHFFFGPFLPSFLLGYVIGEHKVQVTGALEKDDVLKLFNVGKKGGWTFSPLGDGRYIPDFLIYTVAKREKITSDEALSRIIDVSPNKEFKSRLGTRSCECEYSRN